MRNNPKGIIGIVVILALLLAGIAAIVYFYFIGIDKSSGDPFISNIQKTLNITPVPTPFPFEDLTIPYLQSRNYESELGEFTKVSENANYTSYLTSYLSDGFRVYGLLTVPSGNPPVDGWPVVVFLHGYIPPQEYQTLVNYVSYVDFLAERGLVVFKIDLRGHGDSEGEAFGGYYSGDYIVDTLNAVAAIKKLNDPSNVNIQKLIVDPERIGLWGHSMSGNVVFRSFVVSPEILKVVIWAGAVYTYDDFSQFSINDNSYQPPPQDSPRRRYREKLADTYGAFDPADEFWKQVPGTNYLEVKVGEIQIHHAQDDAVVEIGYSRNLMSILDNTDIGHVLFEYPSGGHNLIGSSFNQAMQRSVDFFKK